MAAALDRRRVLLVSDVAERVTLRQLFTHESLASWEVLEASSFDQAHFVLQHDTCDVLLVDEGLFSSTAHEGLARIKSVRDVPWVLLARPEPALITDALRLSVHHWLPRALVLGDPP